MINKKPKFFNWAFLFLIARKLLILEIGGSYLPKIISNTNLEPIKPRANKKNPIMVKRIAF